MIGMTQDYFFDVDREEFRERGECIDKVTDSILEELDEVEWLEDNYTIGELWKAVCNKGEERIRDEMYNYAYDEAIATFDEEAKPGDFEVAGWTFCGLRECETVLP